MAIAELAAGEGRLAQSILVAAIRQIRRVLYATKENAATVAVLACVEKIEYDIPGGMNNDALVIKKAADPAPERVRRNSSPVVTQPPTGRSLGNWASPANG